jgi:hypothetical protein
MMIFVLSALVGVISGLFIWASIENSLDKIDREYVRNR